MTGVGTAFATMIGGPLGGQDGEVVKPPPEWLYFGREGGFCYRLDNRTTPKKRQGQPVAAYRYDRKATHEKLLLLGFPIGVAEQAVSDDETALRATALEGQPFLRERPELGGAEVDVVVELHEDEWRVLVGGDVQHTVARSAIDPEDHESIGELARQVGAEFIKARIPEETPA